MIKKIKKIIPLPVKNIIKKIFGIGDGVKNSDVIPYIKKSLDLESITVLDVGCGKLWEGNDKNEDILFSVFSDPKFKITGIDVFQECIDWRKENGPIGTYLQMDARDIMKIPGKFDVVVSHHVLEHFAKEESEKLLEEIEKKL